MEMWNEQQGQLKKFAALDLEFSYKFGGRQMEEKKTQIIDALAFWKFVDELSLLRWEARRFFLAYFAINSNPLIRIVAMVECLPTSVWRKILWKHNIDFMSFESFLRRLDEKQFEAIKQNYEDLFTAECVPRVFSSFEIFFKGITVEKLLKDGVNLPERYSRKAAMSFNLLNLDFGFNAYPKGVRDDTKVEEISPLKFLSVKNHADDFVVNKEDGKYWWLYRKARSNYVWRPNRGVKLKTHICPGFWYTLLVHFVFWILSPLAFVGITACGLSNASWWITGPVAVIGLIMPIWLILAGLKLLFITIDKLIIALIWDIPTEKNLKPINEWLKKNKSNIITCIQVILRSIAFVMVAMLIIILAGSLFLLLHPDLGATGACAAITAILIYLGYGFFHSEYKFTTFKHFPLYLKIPIMFVVLCLVYKFLLLYQATIISGVFAFVFFLEYLTVAAINIAKTVFLHLISAIILFGVQKFAVMTAIVGIPIAIIAILHHLPEEKQKRFYDVLGKGLWYGCGAYFFSVILVCIYFLVVNIDIIGLTYMSAGIALYGVGVWYLLFCSNPYVKESRWITEYSDGPIDFREVLKNKWLLSLGKSEALSKIRSLRMLSRWIFDQEERYYNEAIRWIMPFISPEVIQKLENHQRLLKNIKNYRLQLMVLKIFVSQDVDFESALSMAKKEMAEQVEREILKAEKEEKFEEWLKAIGKALNIVFFIPIQFWKLGVMILRGIWFAIKKLWEYLATLRRLWELFNERCPYITEQKVLKFK